MKPGIDGQVLFDCLVQEGLSSEQIHLWPAFQIEAPKDPETVKDELLRAAQASIPIVVVSPSAVEQIASLISEWPETTRFATVGEGTAKRIKSKFGDFPILYPKCSIAQSGSERLFELFRAEGIPKSVLIARGQTGREYLREHLEASGCSVQIVTTYNRIPFKAQPTDKSWIQVTNKAPVIYITSSDAIQVLLSNLSKEEQSWIKKGIVLTIHERIADVLARCGFKDVEIVDQINVLTRIVSLSHSI